MTYQIRRTSLESKVFILTLTAGLVPSCWLTLILYRSEHANIFDLLLLLFVVVIVFVLALYLRRRLVYQLATSTNILEALTSGDYSMRVRELTHSGVFSEFNRVLNLLAEMMAQQNIVSREKHILLHKVISQIDVAIIAADEHHNITLVNPAAQRLFGYPCFDMEGWPLKKLGIIPSTLPSSGKVLEFELKPFEKKQSKKRVLLHKDEYFENGLKQQLIFITDIQNLLREEERLAWQKLLRVLSHEINNSLAPITSISDTLLRQMSRDTDCKHDGDLKDGLGVIKERADSLNVFINSYQQLSRIPAAEKQQIDLAILVPSIASLFKDVKIQLISELLVVYADQIQLEQVLVNLIKNAQESMCNKEQGIISISWRRVDDKAIIEISDQGCGISNMDNLFVPFYTTKAKGSGIGLVLCRQLLMNNGGDLNIRNNSNGTGALVSVLLPVV
ncbi:Sensor histidine kinase [Shewanella piezotolerans WP3]|uniref:histidine kinase n=2 Tax=Shewanella TaxID=22 RepID=B8CRM1_SHEPW|nr:Sensor histidine kinase [Shewanella piezotolerans WP3]